MGSMAMELGGTAVGDLAIAADVSVDPRTGAASLTVPLMTPVGRDGFAPQLALSYGSSAGNSAFGAGWGLVGLPSISVRTAEHLPRWDGTDRFELAGEELVPWLVRDADGTWKPREHQDGNYHVRFLRTTSSAQVRIELWRHRPSGRVHFRTRDAGNVVTVFGARLDDLGRIADPADQSRTFSWLPELRIDPFGNAIWIDYLAETTDGIDSSAPAERSDPSLAQRYIKHIRYGNSSPASLSEVLIDGTSMPSVRWHFLVAFDYGDHASELPAAEADRPWPARQDIASSGRAGFEVRTYRLCRRILAFHDFDELGDGPTLIGETVLGHRQDPAGSTLETIGYTGHRRDGDARSSRSLPPLKLHYAPSASEESFVAPPAATRASLPAGLASNARVVDLHGEGLFGVLTEHQGTWSYRQNLGGGEFAECQQVLEKPSVSAASFGFGDIDRDGDLEFSRLSGRAAGAYEYDREAATWQGFRPFEQFPHLEAFGDRAQWIDLNGDGRADIIVAKAESLLWFASKGADDEGFADPVEIPLPTDSMAVPSARSDASTDFFFADMTGDGLADLVRVDSGRVEYWPSLGNGQFADGVVMDAPPFFAADVDFDPARLRFVDLDGSGTTDLIYIGDGEVSCWINASGGGFVPGPQLRGLPTIDNVSSARVLDFLGDGRACLVWSSPLPGADGLRYLPLTPALRPRLLLSIDNSRGHETRLHHSSSASHYLRDKLRGNEWRAPMPGHYLVASQIETIDQIARTRSSLRYEYHDGAFDRQTREPRGFARTDVFDVQTSVQTDGSADSDHASSVEPSVTRTWFHLGTEMRGRHRIRGHYTEDADDTIAELAPHRIEGIDDGGELPSDDWFEALELLAGEVIRSEIYSIDAAGAPSPVPFEVHQVSRSIRRDQPQHAGGPAAFSIDDGHSSTAVLERTAGDPRISHRVVAASDEYGVVVRAAEIAYARHLSQSRDAPAQDQTLVSIVETRSVHIDETDRFELGVPIETKRFEVVGLGERGARIGRSELRDEDLEAALANPQPHHQPFERGRGLGARLLSWEQSFYWNRDRTAPLALGVVGVDGASVLVHHERAACFAREQVEEVFGDEGRASDARLTALGYQPGGELWWQPDAVHLFSSVEEFSRRIGTERADGARSTVEFDAHHLAVVGATNALGVRTSAEIDYHRLTSRQTIDGNGTVRETRADPLGAIVESTSRGDVDGQPWGFETLGDMSGPVPKAADEVIAKARELLGGASSYVWSDLDAWSRSGTPTTVVTLARETLVRDGAGGVDSGGRIQIGIAYLDGLGRELQSRRLVEPGPAIARDDNGAVIVDAGGRPVLEDTGERWLVSGHVVYDAKEQAVEQYEPYHSRTFAFEDDAVLRAIGVSALTRYDAIGRAVATHYPNGTFRQTIIGAWSTEERDANDTVLESAYLATRETLPNDHPQKQALEHAKTHADSSSLTFVDPMGRAVATVARGGGGADASEDVRAETELDIDGQALSITDGRGLEAFRYVRDMAGRILHEHSVDGGPSWGLADAFDRSVYAWNARGFEVERGYDVADRPLFTHVRGGDGGDADSADSADDAMDHRVEEWIYGESLVDANEARARNAIGQIITQRDGAGVVDFESYDPNGDVRSVARRLRVETRNEPDWRQPLELESERLRVLSSYDAAGRPIQKTSADGTVQRFVYSRSGPLTELFVTTADGRLDSVPILEEARFNPRGQPVATRLGNGVALDYVYEPDTQRLSHQRAHRGDRLLQSIKHTYDPAGNLVRLTDEAQEGPGGVISGTRVGARRDYTYDAHYRLRSATGRVHQALLQHDWMPGAGGTVKGTRHISLNSGAAIERFTRRYDYDRAGNLLAVKHIGSSQRFTTAMWVSPSSNRSLAALGPNGNPVDQPETQFDATGNLRRLAHLRRMEWNWRGALSLATVIERTGNTDDDEHYVYGGDGLRVRKVSTAVRGGNQLEQTEALTIGSSTRKQVIRNGTVILERWTTDLGGDERLAILHRWTKDELKREVDDIGQPRIHYQLKTHQGSSAIELDRVGRIISYEEYFPYGGSAFIAGDNLREVKRKDIRYSGKQRDDVTGFYDYGYRCYAPWLCRWLSPDPIGPEDHLNLYQFVLGDPVSNVDAMGLDTEEKGRLSFPNVPLPRGSTRAELVSSFRATLGPNAQVGYDRLGAADQVRAFTKGFAFVIRDPGSSDPESEIDWVVVSKDEFDKSWAPAFLEARMEDGELGIVRIGSSNPERVDPSATPSNSVPSEDGADGEDETTGETATQDNDVESDTDVDADSDEEDGDGSGTGLGIGDGRGSDPDGVIGGKRGGSVRGVLGGTRNSRGFRQGGQGSSLDPNVPLRGPANSAARSAGGESARRAASGVASGQRASSRKKAASGQGAGGAGQRSESNQRNARSSSERGEGPEGVGQKRGTDKPYSWKDVAVDMAGINNFAGRSESGSRGGIAGGLGLLGRKGTFWQVAHIATTVLTGGIVGAIASLPALISSLPKLTWALIKSLPSLLRLGARALHGLLRFGVSSLRGALGLGRSAVGLVGRSLRAIWHLPQLLARLRRPRITELANLSFDEQVALATRHVAGLGAEQAEFILKAARAGESPTSVTFGGSRVRGDFRVGSDIDIGFDGKTVRQATRLIKKIRDQARAAGGLIPEAFQIVPGRSVSGAEPISTAAEFFQRVGVRTAGAKKGSPFGPSGSITLTLDGRAILVK